MFTEAIRVPNNFHTEKSNIPPAFDLDIERRRIQREGVTASSKDRFFLNAWTYAKEHLAQVANTSFANYYLEEDQEGNIVLTTPDYNGLVRDVYNPNRPDWPEYRKTAIQLARAQAESLGFTQFEKSTDLKNAKQGNIFIWTSPPPSDLLNNKDIEGLKGIGYGFHSFTFVYEVKVQDGVRYLESRAIRHYLDAKRQGQLLTDISGNNNIVDRNPTDIDLLKKIVKASTGTSLAIIKNRINKLYQETPENEKIIPPVAVRNLTEEEISKVLSGLNSWLDGIYYLMYFDKRHLFNDLIAKQFHGWENAINSWMAGDDLNLAELVVEDPQIWAIKQMRDHNAGIDDSTSLQSSYMRQTNMATAGGCGLGSGFGSNQQQLATTYESTMREPFSCPECHFATYEKVGNKCPGCGLTKEKDAEMRRSRGEPVCE